MKTGPLAEKPRLMQATLATLSNDYLILKIFNLSNPIVVNKASCQTPAVPVAMGDDYQLKDFEKPEQHSALDTTYPFNAFSPTGTHFQIPCRRRITACPPAP